MAYGDLDDPTDYGSVVRNNLMKRPGYAPYCMGYKRVPGGDFVETACISRMWRMVWDGEQFGCICGCRTEFPADFIDGYRARWHQSDALKGGAA